MKKVREPMFTAEEKASKINKQEIKGTGKLSLLFNIYIYNRHHCLNTDHH